MVNPILKDVTFLPEWFQGILLITFGVFLFVYLVTKIIRLLQSEEWLNVYRSLPGALKKIGDFLQRQVDDPIKSPKFERTTQYIMVFVFYSLSLLLFLIFVVLVLSWAYYGKELSIFQHIGVGLYTLICLYIAAVIKTQGSRELMKIRKQKDTGNHSPTSKNGAGE